MHLLHSSQWVSDVFEGLETDDGADAVVCEGQVVDILDAIDSGAFLEIASNVLARAKEGTQIGDLLLAFRGARADLHQWLRDREVLGDVTREFERAEPHW
jgi:hypothetical protein